MISFVIVAFSDIVVQNNSTFIFKLLNFILNFIVHFLVLCLSNLTSAEAFDSASDGQFAFFEVLIHLSYISNIKQLCSKLPYSSFLMLYFKLI